MKFSAKLSRDALCVSLIVIFSCYNFVSGEEVRFQYCNAATSKICRITKVAGSPCPEALKNEPCSVRKKDRLDLTASFIPNFSTNNVTIQISARLVLLYLADENVDRHGCKFTTCPIVAGQQYTVALPYNVPNIDLFTPGTYTAKFRLWNSHKPSEECCFLYKFKLLE